MGRAEDALNEWIAVKEKYYTKRVINSHSGIFRVNIPEKILCFQNESGTGISRKFSAVHITSVLVELRSMTRYHITAMPARPVVYVRLV